MLRVLISAGPTREPIDPVRYLSNYSTGVMGACLAQEALRRGHAVSIVLGPATEAPPKDARVIHVERADQMQRALRSELPRADVLIMAAAVCDFRPAHVQRQKLSRAAQRTLTLVATPDIVGHLPRRAGQLVVGFALETADGLTRVREKLRRKRLDLIVGQVARPGDSPFGHRPLTAVLVEASGAVTEVGRIEKPQLARAILDKIEALWYGGVLSRRAVSVGAAHRRVTQTA